MRRGLCFDTVLSRLCGGGYPSTQFCLGCEKLGGRSTSTQVSEVSEKGVPLLRSFLRVQRNKSNPILQNFLGVVRKEFDFYIVGFPGC